MHTSLGLFFDDNEELLNKEILLKKFGLSNEDIRIDFDKIEVEIYKIDIENTQPDEYTPRSSKIRKGLLNDELA